MSWVDPAIAKLPEGLRLRAALHKVFNDRDEREAMIEDMRSIELVYANPGSSHRIITETGVNIMPRDTMRSKQIAPDAINWMGIEPHDLVFTADEIIHGEIQCARLDKTVVYLTRVPPGPEGGPHGFKVTRWTSSRLVHRNTFDDLAKAQADYTDQVRTIAVDLAIEVLS